jgi:hypothetical protein
LRQYQQGLQFSENKLLHSKLDASFIPGTTIQDFENVEIYAQINPQLEQIDLDAGISQIDEYLNSIDKSILGCVGVYAIEQEGIKLLNKIDICADQSRILSRLNSR